MNPNTRICNHLRAIIGNKMPDTLIKGFIGELQKLDQCNFVPYCKEVKSLCKDVMSGSVLDPSDFHHIAFKHCDEAVDTGYSTSQHYMPKSAFLYEALTLSCEPPIKDQFLASLMKLQTALEPRPPGSKPSRKAVEDATASICNPSSQPTITPEMWEYVDTVTRALCVQYLKVHRTDRLHYFTMLDHPATNTKATAITPRGDAMLLSKSTFRTYSLTGFMSSQAIQDLYKSDPDTFCSRLFTGEPSTGCSLKLPPVQNKQIPLSTISFIGEPGEKERVVAIPTLALQSLSYPIGKIAKRFNSMWKVQGVDSHVNAVNDLYQVVQNQPLTEDIYSVDMSSFTDRFPYDYFIRRSMNIMVEYGILSPFDISVMDCVCKTPISLDGKIAHYGTGTPMGTFPSFPLASLCNGILAAASHMKAQGVPLSDITFGKLNNIPFRIIGDDVVCWVSSSAKQYIENMRALGVTIQDSKSVVSPLCCEFCSKFITKNGIFPQKKLFKVGSENAFTAMVENYQYYGDIYLDYHPSYKEDILEVATNPYYGFAQWTEDNSHQYSYQTDIIVSAIHVHPPLAGGYMDISDMQILANRKEAWVDLQFTHTIGRQECNLTFLTTTQQSLIRDMISLSEDLQESIAIKGKHTFDIAFELLKLNEVCSKHGLIPSQYDSVQHLKPKRSKSGIIDPMLIDIEKVITTPIPKGKEETYHGF